LAGLKHPVYPQQFGEFISHLSVVDAVQLRTTIKAEQLRVNDVMIGDRRAF